MKELKEFKNRTAKQREDYESKYTVLKKELGQMEDSLLEENVASKDNTKDDDEWRNREVDEEAPPQAAKNVKQNNNNTIIS